MVTIVISALALIAAAVGIVLIGYRLLKFPHEGLPNLFSYHKLGSIEGNLPDLQRVIVVAHSIEDPQNELREAVKKNFSKGIRYLFLVSKSTAQDELQGYYKIFRTLAEIVTKSGPNLVDIQELPYDWPSFPYVLYETRPADSSEPNFLVFRGSQKKEGIADYYSPVDSGPAYIIARAVLSDSPHPITVRSDQFEQASNVLSFPEQPAGETEVAAVN
jgi:hypothetical protein